MKTCKRCDTAKPLTEFYAERLMPDGLRNWCKACKRSGALTLQERFEGRLLFMPDDCWQWTGARSTAGYGMFQVGKRSAAGNASPALAHRVAYELFVGSIPEGLQLDHLCRNRSCVNPAHLEPVTNQENAIRGHAARRGVALCA